MGDNRNSAIAYVGLVGTTMQLVAGFLGVGAGESLEHNSVVAAYALLTAGITVAAIVAFASVVRGRRDLGRHTTLFAGGFLLWHVFALVLLTGARGLVPDLELFVYVLAVWDLSVIYQVTQVLLFGVVVASALHSGQRSDRRTQV